MNKHLLIAALKLIASDAKKTTTNLRKAYLNWKKRGKKSFAPVKEIKKEYENVIGEKVSDQRFANVVINNEAVYSIETEIARSKSESIKIDYKNIGLIRVLPESPPKKENDKIYV